MFQETKIVYHQGFQYIPNVRKAQVPGIFKGRPIISLEMANEQELMDCCPTNAIEINPLQIDLGKCTFCGICEKLSPNKIRFTKDFHVSSNRRENLIVKAGEDKEIKVESSLVRSEIRKTLHNSLKLRQVSAAGDNSAEWELNAAGNVQFDIGRFGIEFVASPRHADGIVITGPISINMAKPLEICYNDTPAPKIIVLCGTDAISGGIFAGTPALNRQFIDNHTIDLYIPGNPPHPLTIINGFLDLTGVTR